MQGVQGKRFLKAPIVTTGIPGTTDGIGGTADRADESPTSFLHGLSSMESPMSSQRTAAEFHELRVLGTDQLTIAREPAGSLGSVRQLTASCVDPCATTTAKTGRWGTRARRIPISFVGDSRTLAIGHLAGPLLATSSPCNQSQASYSHG